MYITNPDSYLLPTYRISPFVTSSIKRNRSIPENSKLFALDYLNQRFGEGNWLLTYNGREAIRISLFSLGVASHQKVRILTTSGNTYISGCVTSELEKFCSWNRNIESSDLNFVNHEFGYPYANMEYLLSTGLPLIEDCCTTFFSQDKNNKIGRYGTFAIYSFPKFFSIQIGGLLVGENVSKNADLLENDSVSEDEKDYILKVLGFELSREEELLGKREVIFDYAVKSFQQLGFSLRFPIQKDVVPSVLLLNNHGIIKDLQAHKLYLNKHGIQNSVFYGDDAFFIPCHQNLTETDIDYFKFVTENFINT